MKLFYPQSHYDDGFRGHVFPLLKPFLKEGDFSNQDRIDLYGISETEYQIVRAIEECDVVILTMSWNYYVLTKQLKVAKDFVAFAMKKGKIVWVANVMDSPLKFPYQEGCLIFEPGGYASNLTTYQRIIPIFIKDPLTTYYNQTHFFKREYHPIPTVGFCGLADGSRLNKYVTQFKIFVRNILSVLGLRHLKPERMIAPAFLRHEILKIIRKSSLIQDHFILRSAYRAGIKTNQASHPSTLEFYDNIKDSDYVLCVRGAGNFSVRFYETLAMGRIPVFVNTDCILPLGHIINWKNHVVWVEQHEIPMIDKKILAFHKNLNQDTLNSLFLSNRKLWEIYLTMDGFFKTFRK